MTRAELHLQAQHCRAVCDELRAEVTRLKTSRIELAKEVDEAVERAGELAAKVEQLEIQCETYRKALRTIANSNSYSSVNDLRQYASGFVDSTGR